MQSHLCVLTLCLFMEMWYRMLTSVRHSKNTGKMSSKSFLLVNISYPHDCVAPMCHFACAQASSKDGEEHLSDDDDLQGIISRSQVPL